MNILEISHVHFFHATPQSVASHGGCACFRRHMYCTPHILGSPRLLCFPSLWLCRHWLLIVFHGFASLDFVAVPVHTFARRFAPDCARVASWIFSFILFDFSHGFFFYTAKCTTSVCTFCASLNFLRHLFFSDSFVLPKIQIIQLKKFNVNLYARFLLLQSVSKKTNAFFLFQVPSPLLLLHPPPTSVSFTTPPPCPMASPRFWHPRARP